MRTEGAGVFQSAQMQGEQKQQQRSQSIAEPLAGVVQTRHDGPHRNVERFGDLAVGEPFEVTQHDDLSVILGQRVERLHDLPALLGAGGRLIRGLVAGVLVGQHALPLLLRHPLGAERPALRAA